MKLFEKALKPNILIVIGTIAILCGICALIEFYELSLVLGTGLVTALNKKDGPLDD